MQIPATLPADLPPLLRRVYAARRVRDGGELDHSLQRLHPADTLTGIDAAAGLLAEHVARDSRILVVGDFDADGATSTAVALHALRAMGARDVRYLVPNRFEFGYGLTPEIVALAREQAPNLLITVDNGISSLAGVTAARAAGMDVLVTDHHLPGAQLPDANVIVNPNLPGDLFPSKALAGVGVIFYLMLALRRRLRDSGRFGGSIAEPNLAELLDLVALGTVADVVPLDANNRILVAQGIKRIRAGACRPGIQALLQVARRSRAGVVASDLGFALGPRLNAAGRLEDMSLGIECLLTNDLNAAAAMAQRLDELNRERRDIETRMQAEALTAVSGMKLDAGSLPLGVCLFEPGWHQGVVGLVASRVKDKLHRPVIAFAHGDEQTLKGSARSIPGLHVRDTLDAIAARHPGLITKFGGHAMAAGLSIRLADYPAFSTAFDAEVRRLLGAEALTGVLLSDGELAADEICLENALLLREAGPWGQGFPEPLFDGVFEVLERRIVGERHLKLKLGQAGGKPLDAIAFNDTGALLPEDANRARIAYRLDVNDYRGLLSAQLVVEYMEAV